MAFGEAENDSKHLQFWSKQINSIIFIFSHILKKSLQIRIKYYQYIFQP